MNFATAQEFYDFCVRSAACKEGLVEIKGLTLAEWWDKTNRGDWMLWLRDEGVWDFTPVQLAEYHRITAPAWAEYERITAQAIREIIGNPFKV